MNAGHEFLGGNFFYINKKNWYYPDPRMQDVRLAVDRIVLNIQNDSE